MLSLVLGAPEPASDPAPGLLPSALPPLPACRARDIAPWMMEIKGPGGLLLHGAGRQRSEAWWKVGCLVGVCRDYARLGAPSAHIQCTYTLALGVV